MPIMMNITRRSRLFQLVLLTFALSGCSSAVDDEGAFTASAEATDAASEALKGAAAIDDAAALDADAGDCDAAPDKAGAKTDAYEEFTSILEAPDLSVELAPAGNSCWRICKCCKRGNRYCCAHCKFCSGPIGVSTGVLAQ
jgi:hypothetical protein